MTSTTAEATNKQKDKEYEVAINGTAHTLHHETVTYEELGSSRTRATTRRHCSP